MKKILLYIACFIYSLNGFAQDYPRKQLDVDAFVDDLFQQQDEGVNYEMLYENLVNYYQNPINLNNCDYEELSALLVLSDAQIKNILRHIEKNGKLLSIYELQSIDGMNIPTIFQLLPFVQVDDVVMQIDAGPLWQRMLHEDNNSILIRTEMSGGSFTANNGTPYSNYYKLEPQDGYITPEPKSDGTLPTHYEGGPLKHYIRYRVSHKNDFSLGFLAEKDKGEQFTWDGETKRYGMDFYSFHFHTYNKGRFKSIAIGDYQMQDGQSLIFAGGFLIGKSPETINSTRRTSIGIRPYTSAIEGGFFRGAAATYKLHKQLDITVMGSRLKVDAKALESNDSLVDVGDFTISLSSLNSGLHRTETEISKKQNSTKYDVGSVLKYNSKDKKLQAGISLLQTVLSDTIKTTDDPRNIGVFQGKSNLVYGGNYSYNWKNFNVFGELAQSQSGGIGAVQGILGSLSKKLQVALQFRHFDPNFHSIYADPFAESGAKNENGVYWGMKYKFNNKWELSAYYDRFWFPWLRSQVDQPSYGDEYLGRLQYKPQRRVTMYFQHKNETKLRNQSDNITKGDFAVPTTKQTQIVNIDYNVSKIMSLKSRVQWSYFQQSNGISVGYMALQDINFKFNKWRLSARYAIFDTEGSNNAQYTYERDVLYAYSIYSFSGIGVRKFIMLRYTPFQKVDFWLKVARTTYDHFPGISVNSGQEEIIGNKRTDIRLQMRYNF